MSIVPCQHNENLKRQVEEFAEELKTRAPTFGGHGLSESDFYQGGVFRGAIERIRGQFSATMRVKREFVRLVLNHMQDRSLIVEWTSAGGSNRHDYTITMPSGRTSVVELKGCLDGNNTTIFERPASANEFFIWSVCSNSGADPRHNVWSGIHTRLGPEIITEEKQVDGLIVWDWICGTIGRPCPKIDAAGTRLTAVGQYRLTPPCIYLFPGTVPSVRTNPDPAPHTLQDVHFLHALNECFGGASSEINSVRFSVAHKGRDTVRVTRIERNGVIQRESEETPIRRE